VITTKQIVVGIDGSSSGAHALAWAAGEAERKGVELVIAHAIDTITPMAVSSATVVTVMMESGDYGRELLTDAIALLAARHPTVPVSTILRQGKPAELLIELGTSDRMLVVGTHGRGHFLGARIGSVSQRVAAHAHCPVVVISNEEVAAARAAAAKASAGPATTTSSDPSTDRRVVVGVLASSAGHETLRFAFQQAVERRASLLAICAFGSFSRTAHDPILVQLTDVRQREEAELRDTLIALQSEFPTVRTEARVVDEPVDDALCLAASNAELLVVGCSHDDSTWPSRLGPVTSRLLHTSPCPIVVVGSARAAALAAR
jgi:nucleotide-binding universal stress UspA family protein